MLEFLLQWHNVPLMIALLVGVGLVVLDLVTGSLGISADVDGDIDVDLNGDGWDVLGLFGIGRVPIAILLEVLLMSFAMWGLITSAVIFDIWPSVGPWLTPVIYGNAFLGSLITTRIVGGFIAKVLPNDAADPPATRFVGDQGIVTALVTATSGEMKVDGTYLEARASSGITISRGTLVHIVSYQPEGWFFVTPVGVQDI